MDGQAPREDPFPLIGEGAAPRRSRLDDYIVQPPTVERACPSVQELDGYTQQRLFAVLTRTKSTFRACEAVHVPQRTFWHLKANNPEFARMVDRCLDTPDIEEAMSDDDVTNLARTQLIRKMQGGVKRHAQVSWRREWREGETPDDGEMIEVESTTETVTEVEPDLKAIEFWLINKSGGEFQKSPKPRAKEKKLVQGMKVQVPQQFIEQAGAPESALEGMDVDFGLEDGE